MPYIGNQPGTGVRSRFIYTATASQTTFSGADDNSKTLKYADSAYVDVFLNGICLVPGTDYTASTKTSIVLTQAASLNDTLEVVAYDIASMDDSISKSSGGTFEADIGVSNTSPDLTFTNSTSEDTDGGRESTITFKGKQSGSEESTLAQIQASHDGTSDDEKGDLIFRTNDGSDGNSPTEAMRIDSAGRTIIGHTDGTDGSLSAEFKLQLLGTDYTTSGIGLARFENGVNASTITLHKSRGASIGDDTVVQDDDELGRFRFFGNDGTDFAEGARITARVNGTPGSNDMPSELVFSTTPDGAQTPVERMTIDNGGHTFFTLGTNAMGSFSDNISEVGTGNFCFQVANSSAAALKPLGIRAEDIRFAIGSAERMRIADTGTLGLKASADNMLLDRGAVNVNHIQEASGGEFTNPHIALNLGSSPTNNSSVCMISYATSDSDNYGYTVGSKRSSAGNGSFLINHHVNDASGTTRLSINGSGSLNVMGVYNDTTTSSANVNVASDGHIRRVVSSRRYKNTINDATHGLAELLTLRSVTYKGNNEDFVVGGLIAEEVHDAGLTEFVEYDDDGEPDSLAYSNMVSLCIKAIQEQQATITAQATKIETLETQNTTQATQIADLITRVEALEAE